MGVGNLKQAIRHDLGQEQNHSSSQPLRILSHGGFNPRVIAIVIVGVSVTERAGRESTLKASG